MANFKDALKKVLKEEGGHVNDPRDNGGETYRGISRRYFPKWEGWFYVDQKDFGEAVQKHVAEFYYTYFWLKIRGDQIEDQLVAELLFSFAVNAGKKKAVQKIQRVVGVKTDGLIGNVTVNAINSAHPDRVFLHFYAELVEFYTVIGKRQPHFLRGWLNRILGHYYDWEARSAKG